MAIKINKCTGYHPSQGLNYLNQVHSKIESMGKYATVTYMFSIQDENPTYSQHAVNLICKAANRENLDLKLTSFYKIYKQGKQVLNLSLMLSSKTR